jgi:hypothetical protein
MQDLEDSSIKLENMEREKNKSIKEIKSYFDDEEEKYLKNIEDKDNNLKLLN